MTEETKNDPTAAAIKRQEQELDDLGDRDTKAASTNSRPKGKGKDPEADLTVPAILRAGEDYLNELGYFRVGIDVPGLGERKEDGSHGDRKNAVVVTDPGATHFAILSKYDEVLPDQREGAYVALARSILEWDLPSIRGNPKLEVGAGETLPLPSTLVDSHNEEWHDYREQMKVAMRVNSKLAREAKVELEEADELEGYQEYPSYPDTRLETLFRDEVPTQVLMRIVAGVMHAALKFGGPNTKGTDSGN